MMASDPAGSPGSGPAAEWRPPHVYVHVPFCARRCTYCDFAITVRRRVPGAAFVAGIGRELDVRFPAADPAWRLRTLYLGGGTPSALGAEGVRDLMRALTRRLSLDANAEVTLEANPEDVTPAASAAWRAAGINRISLGVQSFHQPTLAWMHRAHDAARVVAAVRALRRAGFGNISADLIFAVPQSLGRPWVADLDALLSLEPEHVSLYGLTVEPGTALGRWVDRGLASEAPEEVYEWEYVTAHERMASAGYEHYEVSNFARPGHLACHNRAYWSGAAYLGLGPAAHGFDGQVRRWNTKGYREWEGLVSDGRDPLEGMERVSPAGRATERAYLELRTTAGTVLSNEELTLARPWVQSGWGRLVEGRLVLTARGWLRLDSLAAVLANVRTQ